MLVTLEISRETILHGVKLQTHYFGEYAKEGGDNVATLAQANDEDDDVLNKFIQTSAARVIDILTPYLKTADYSEGESMREGELLNTFIYTFDFPVGFDKNQMLLESIKDYMINYTLYRWCVMTKKDESRIYEVELQKAEDGLKHRVNQRSSPVRRKMQPF